MRVFKTKCFARKERIGDRTLREAVEQAERGLIDADLGNGMIKQRVALRARQVWWISNDHHLPVRAAGDFRLWLCQEQHGEH